MTNTKLTVFSILHILGTCAIIFLFITLVGCKQEEVFDSENYEVTSKALMEALTSASPNPSENNLSGDSVTLQTVAKAYSGDYQYLGKNHYEIRDKKYVTETQGEDTLDYNLFDVYHAEYDSSNQLKLARESECRLIRKFNDIELIGWYPECSISLPPFQDQLWILSSGMRANKLSLLEANYEIQPHTATGFYNLKTYKKRVTLPQKMIDENRCYDLKNCQFISDVVEFKLKSGTQEVHVTLHFSKELPYLASNFSRCELQVIDNVPYTICNSVIDFTQGTPDSN